MIAIFLKRSDQATVVAIKSRQNGCTIWDDVRTRLAEALAKRAYLTSTIDPQEKTALLAAIIHFKKKE